MREHVGGDRRPDGRRTGRGRLDHRCQPAVAGPHRARSSASHGWRACSPPPAGRCSPSNTACCSGTCSRAPAARRCARAWTQMPNPEYQRLLRCGPAELRERLPGGGTPTVATLIADLDDAALRAAVRNLGGHDLAALGDAFAAIEDDPPDGHLRLHHQGLRTGHRGPPAKPLRPAHRIASSPNSPPRLGADPQPPVGTIPGRLREPQRSAPTPHGGCAADNRRPCRTRP